MNESKKPGLGKTTYAVFVLLAATAIALPAQTFSTLHSFAVTDGQGPAAGVIQGTNGYLYGTTKNGGANCAPVGCGTVYKITPSGTLTTIYSFCAQPNCTDGKYPLAGGAGGTGGVALVQATNGNFYGTTASGGAFGKGTVFQITPSGALTTIYSFAGAPTDGTESVAGLVQATNGLLYGTTSFGGTRCVPSQCAGTVFKITTSGILTTLYSFTYSTPFGFSPPAGLIQATNGLIYGATSSTACCAPPDASPRQTKPHGPGGIFQITPSGALTPLYTFCSLSGCTDGENPFTGLVQAADGQLYGTASNGGAYGFGTIFQITPTGALTTLYNFCSQSGCPDGTHPDGLIQGSDGNLYGTAYSGGANGVGTIFQMTPSGTLTTLHSFDVSDGSLPFVGLTQATDGNFYGTTYAGGANGAGAIFSISIGLPPFVETQTSSGKVGAPVRILGTNLTGAASVTFNGTPATFTVASKSLISTTVPAGATTGTIQVVTPGGTLLSNFPFGVQ